MSVLGLLDWIYLVCIIIGSSLLLARIVLQLVGAAHSGDIDAPSHGGDFHPADSAPSGHDFSADHPGADHDAGSHDVNSNEGLKIFTLQGLM